MMESQTVLVDSNVLLDIVTEDQQWFDWSSEQLDLWSQRAVLAINPIIYAEVSIGFERIEELEDALPTSIFIRESIPWEACFLAGKSFLHYRKTGGVRSSPLPDFFIGAHALVRGMSILTRDEGRFRSYFPKLRIICPT